MITLRSESEPSINAQLKNHGAVVAGVVAIVVCDVVVVAFAANLRLLDL